MNEQPDEYYEEQLGYEAAELVDMEAKAQEYDLKFPLCYCGRRTDSFDPYAQKGQKNPRICSECSTTVCGYHYHKRLGKCSKCWRAK